MVKKKRKAGHTYVKQGTGETLAAPHLLHLTPTTTSSTLSTHNPSHKPTHAAAHHLSLDQGGEKQTLVNIGLLHLDSVWPQPCLQLL